MRTWILFSTFALALPLAACGDDTGGTGGAGGGDTGSTSDSTSSSGTTNASSSSGGTAAVQIFTPCEATQTPDAEITNSGSTAFSPTTATIPAGGIVRFASTGAHDMSALDGSWETQTSAPETCIVFNEPGTYDFECSVHPNMTGTITVQ